MNKELSPLEALKKIRDDENGKTPLTFRQANECLDLVENALKGLEEKAYLNDNYIKLLGMYDLLKTDYDELLNKCTKNTKKLKAFEIIKELLNLRVVQLLPNDSDTRLFVKCGVFNASVLIPPAYIDLLKEVLL